MRWLLITMLVLMSCTGTGRVDGPVLTSPHQPLVGGVVVFDENTGCLLLGGRYPVVWPAGASWQADPPAVKLQGQLIEPDMTVEGGGGFLKYEHVKGTAGAVVADAARRWAGPTGDGAFFDPG